MHTQQTSNIDLVTELSHFVCAMSSKILKNSVYIEDKVIVENYTPKMVTNRLKSKKLIAWYKQNCSVIPTGDLMLCGQIFRTLAEMTQGPCIMNQITLAKARALRPVLALLEYLGSFNYRKYDSKNKLLWTGHGIEMYLNYIKKFRVQS